MKKSRRVQEYVDWHKHMKKGGLGKINLLQTGTQVRKRKTKTPQKEEKKTTRSNRKTNGNPEVSVNTEPWKEKETAPNRRLAKKLSFGDYDEKCNFKETIGVSRIEKCFETASLPSAGPLAVMVGRQTR